jgi:hypothetical protein
MDAVHDWAKMPGKFIADSQKAVCMEINVILKIK